MRAMKAFLLLMTITVLSSGCSGPGGPAQRAGASVDNAIYNVGQGVERTGDAIKRSVD